jgi:microcystin-dependent protein
MKTQIRLAALLLLSTISHPPSTCLAQGTAFTYQGRLNSGGGPANGSYDLAFTLFNANTTGVAVAGPVTNSATAVSNGLFTTAIDFGPGVFLGGSNWLEMAVSTNGANSFSTLAPHQQLTPTPYALYAPNAGSAATATTAASAGSVAAANIAGTLTPSQLPAGVLTNGASGVNISGTFSGNGTGLTNLSGANLITGSVGTAQLAGGTLAAPAGAGGTNINGMANTSYVVTNASTTTIVLPANANVGDVVQITGEGAGGWTLQQAGSSWTQTSLPTNSSSWFVASSDDGSHLVAASSGSYIYTSTNFGTTWTQTSAPATNWSSVASSSDGSHLAAVAFGYGVYTSTNFGTTWTLGPAVVSGNHALVQIASSSDGSHLVVGDIDVFFAFNGGHIYTSTNFGTTWTQTSAPAEYWTCVASSTDGSHLAAGAAHLYTSTNFGVDWTLQTSVQTVAPWRSVALSADGSHLAAVYQNGGIYTSSNFGVNWTLQTNAPTTNWFSVASSADGTCLVAVVYGGGIYNSTNSGATWTPMPAPFKYWRSVASSADGIRLVAGAQDGIYTSHHSFLTASGGAGTTATVQYLGNGQWGAVSLDPSSLPANVVTNTETGVTLSGIFSGNGSGLTSLPANAALLNGNQTFSGNVSVQSNLTAAAITTTGSITATNFVGPGTIPVGGIIMWSGSSVPSGWALCDGSNGTPDLRGRFVLASGAGSGLTPRTLGTSGGTETHALTIAEIPAHSHSGGVSTVGYTTSYSTGSEAMTAPGSARNNGTQTFTTGSAGGGAAFDKMPPYYVLAFIMRVQ